jgi:Ca2+-binding EF-hand superfamily protein
MTKSSGTILAGDSRPAARGAGMAPRRRCGSTAPGLRTAALVAVLGLLGACSAYAQMQGPMRGNFDDADANHDGRVTLAEFKDYLTKRLTAGNGPVAQRFKQLSPQEQADRLQKRFNKLDHGQKGYLDRNDWSGS